MARFIGSSKQNKKLLSLVKAAIDAKRIPYLVGEPGIGKTATVEALAEGYGAKLRVLVGSTIDPVDLIGYPRISQNEYGDAIAENTMPDWLDFLNRAAVEDGISFLFLDEFTTSPPSVQAGFLTITQSRRVGKYTLHENIVIICAANPPSQAADGWVLAPPMANRMFHIEVKPSYEDWMEGMLVNWNKPMSDREQQMRELIVAFHRADNYEYIQQIPDDPEAAGGAWPSMRSWDNAASIISAAPDDIVYDVLRGCVGQKAADGYRVWAERQKLPNYEEIIANPEKFNWPKMKADQAQLILSQVYRRMDETNIPASLHVFQVAQEAGKTTICASLALPLAKKVRDIRDEFGVNHLNDVLTLIARYNQDMAIALQKESK